MMLTIAFFAVGAVSWTLGEYVLHRFVMHAMRGRGIASREHLKHHAIRNYYATTSQKAATAVVATTLIYPLAWLAVGSSGAIAYCTGFVLAYVAYEVLHRRAHTHPPRTVYGRWLRKNHFLHHFRTPLRNHGVSTPIWDHVFATHDDANQVLVRVPRRYAMGWLLNVQGELRSEFRHDYVLVGEAVNDEHQRELDRVAAFANQAPSVSTAT